jgi:hypothetical protein
LGDHGDIGDRRLINTFRVVEVLRDRDRIIDGIRVIVRDIGGWNIGVGIKQRYLLLPHTRQ